MRTVIFLGAGAGKADGRPLQEEVFARFFSEAGTVESRRQLAAKLASFFSSVFGVDPLDAPSALLPTFEETLGVLDLAIGREEALPVRVESAQAVWDLRQVRRELVLALAATVSGQPAGGDSVHARLIASLRDGQYLDDIAFITTNYDTLLDDAIDARAVAGERGTGSLLDYGLDDLSPQEEGLFADERRFLCLKIHGSLNWLQCPICDKLDITYGSDSVTRLVDEPEEARCLVCETLRTPVIVPPSYYKDLSNVHLAVVWAKSSRVLRSAAHIVFCGYSFPDADIHVKYLLKRAQLNREYDPEPLKISLVNQYPSKPADVSAVERKRFERFFGGVEIVDQPLSFEQFATNPGLVLD